MASGHRQERHTIRSSRQRCAFRTCPSKSGDGISMFVFPKNSERAKLWLEACGRRHLLSKTKIHKKYYKLCELHFEDRFIISFGSTRKNLLPNAIPTLFPKILNRQCSEEIFNKKMLSGAKPQNNDSQQNLNKAQLAQGKETLFEEIICADGIVSEETVVDNLGNTSNSSDTEDENLENTSNSSDGEEDICLRNERVPFYFDDFDEADIEDETKAKRFWKVAHTTVNSYKSKNQVCLSKLQAQKKIIDKLRTDLMRKNRAARETVFLLEGDE